VRSDEYPDQQFASVEEGKHEGVIGNGGLMLARIPEETVEERTEYFRDQTRNQMTAVDQDLMKEQHPSMPIEKSRRSQVTFGKE
jgi:type VI protein secretion system component VasF